MTTPTRRSLVTWRYIQRRNPRVVHALRIRSEGHDATALCGAAPVWFVPSSQQWYGSGSQDEYEQVARLPECKRCAKLLTEGDTT